MISVSVSIPNYFCVIQACVCYIGLWDTGHEMGLRSSWPFLPYFCPLLRHFNLLVLSEIFWGTTKKATFHPNLLCDLVYCVALWTGLLPNWGRKSNENKQWEGNYTGLLLKVASHISKHFFFLQEAKYQSKCHSVSIWSQVWRYLPHCRVISPLYVHTLIARVVDTMESSHQLLLGVVILVILELFPLPQVEWLIVLCPVRVTAASIYPYIKCYTRWQ